VKKTDEITLDSNDEKELKSMVHADLKKLLDITSRKMDEAGINIAAVGIVFLDELVMYYIAMLLETYLSVMREAALRASAEGGK